MKCKRKGGEVGVVLNTEKGRKTVWSCGCKIKMEDPKDRVFITETTFCVEEEEGEEKEEEKEELLEVRGTYGAYRVQVGKKGPMRGILELQCGECLGWYVYNGIVFLKRSMKWYCSLCEEKVREQWMLADRRQEAQRFVRKFERL